jgi:hypothetical protein
VKEIKEEKKLRLVRRNYEKRNKVEKQKMER